MNARKLTALLMILTLICMLSLTAGAAPDETGLTTSEVHLKAEDLDGYKSSETPLGSFAADAVRVWTHTDFAVVCSGDIGEDLEAGEITLRALELSFPGESEIFVIAVSAAQLRELIEAMVSDVVLNEAERIDRELSESARFPQISGFSFTYNVPALPGTRVTSMTPEGGAELDLAGAEALYTLAVSSRALDGAGMRGLAEGLETVGLLCDIVTDVISGYDVLSEEPSTGRIRALGAYENTLISSIPTSLLIICVVIIAVFSGVKYRNRFKDER